MMKWILLVLMACFSIVQAVEFDAETEATIFEVIHSEEFTNTLLYYRYGQKEYPIRIIHNPLQQKLFSSVWDNPSTATHIFVGALPYSLACYLESLLSELWSREEVVVDFHADKNTLDAFASVETAAIIGERIDDPRLDPLIVEVFQSPQYENQVFYYCLDNIYYRVRIIHNPENLSIKSSKTYKFFKLRDWNDTFGIFIDKKAPQTLVDHFSRLLKPTWWQRHFEITIEDGYIYAGLWASEGSVSFPVDTWYNFAEGFPKSIK